MRALVHAAGVLRVGSLGKLQASDGELMWRLHVESIARIANVVLPGMASARDGRVVLIGSRVAKARPGAASTPRRRRRSLRLPAAGRRR